ncbi:MAG: hypothetical protein ABIQ32_02030 [Sphingomicrobium sp.]
MSLLRAVARMLYDPDGLRRMAEQCRTMASTRQTEELRGLFLRMAHHYDSEAAVHEARVQSDRTRPTLI